MKQRKYPVAVAIFAEATRLNPTNHVNFLLRASALIYQLLRSKQQSISNRMTCWPRLTWRFLRQGVSEKRRRSIL
jgi:hypothetical protein